MTFHGAQNLREVKRPNPYLTLFLVHRDHPKAPPVRILAHRTPVANGTLNPVWESFVVGANVRSSDVIEWEVRSWKRGAGDVLFGSGTWTPPTFPPVPQLDHVQVPLKGDSARGCVVVSLQVAPPAVDRSVDIYETFGIGKESSYESIPYFPIHAENHGVKLANFRDIGGWMVSWTDPRTGEFMAGRMRTGMLFRTSGISRATERDTQRILELGVKTLIDLRTPDYAGNRGPFLSQYFKVVKRADDKLAEAPSFIARDTQQTMMASTFQKKVTESEDTPPISFDNAAFDFEAESATYEGGRAEWGKLLLCSLVTKGFEREIIRRSTKAALLTAGLRAKTPQEQRLVICGPIFNNPDGLVILYQMFIEKSKEKFLDFLTLLETNELPIAYFCNHGKDRTGLCTAFVQSICGVNRETIIANYHLSEYFLRPIANIVDFEMTDGGMDPKFMSPTPAHVMRLTLEYIDSRYASVEKYLDHIGFTFQRQDTLRKRLVAEIPDADYPVPEPLPFTPTPLPTPE